MQRKRKKASEYRIVVSSSELLRIRVTGQLDDEAHRPDNKITFNVFFLIYIQGKPEDSNLQRPKFQLREIDLSHFTLRRMIDEC
ncbi:uncharacterized protein PHALS_07023 [Plasmopara halstedii]|uniref:Uncharacterized protein n=1 Tax=Plasmopara halstedii TaxID=4781 RepID=A0A0N7L895_PLAHL|nr:uncharacterized protein PHALS_07023 [Plasmopara halstedii]CEG49251.1 hypothetical protein PHALS_07023 [Plasmopara halstedii]|eukprot:XP_024585620.1 hypothetical protein PHALS_07023 [Plasmopara halstedii]